MSTPENGRSLSGSSHPVADITALRGLRVRPFAKESIGYVTELEDTLEEFRFVVSKKGFLDVVPNLARVDDSIAIFKGGRVSFYLAREYNNTWMFSRRWGDFFQGIMDEEGLSLPGVAGGSFDFIRTLGC